MSSKFLGKFRAQCNAYIEFSVQVIAAGMNPIQLARGIDKTAKALVPEITKMSRMVLIIKYPRYLLNVV